MHELLDVIEGYDRYGNTGFIWLCACGRRGKGSKKMVDARAAYKRHQQNDPAPARIRRVPSRNTPAPRRPSRDW